jgi:hypothetical protein
MNRILLGLALALGTVVATVVATAVGMASGAEPEPLSVVEALMDAERATDLELALSLFADDAFIVNVAGAKITRAGLGRFLEADMWLHESFALEQATVHDNRVSWTRPVDAEFYRAIEVAPVHFAFVATVDNGRIRSIVAHVPRGEIQRIEDGCRRAGTDPAIYGQPCSEFLQIIRSHAKAASAVAERS